MVRKVLCIVLTATTHPLTIQEMNVALNVTLEAQSITDLDLEVEPNFKSRLRTLCGLFVSVYDNRVYFFHQTAREFLLKKVDLPISMPVEEAAPHWRHSITMPGAHKVLAEVCATFLNIVPSVIIRSFNTQHAGGFTMSSKHMLAQRTCHIL